MGYQSITNSPHAPEAYEFQHHDPRTLGQETSNSLPAQAVEGWDGHISETHPNLHSDLTNQTLSFFQDFGQSSSSSNPGEDIPSKVAGPGVLATDQQQFKRPRKRLRHLESQAQLSTSAAFFTHAVQDDHCVHRRYEREASLLMHYLDHVFPVHFPFYNPPIAEGGRNWLLASLTSSRSAYYATLGLSELHSQAVHSHGKEGKGADYEEQETHYKKACRHLQQDYDLDSLTFGKNSSELRKLIQLSVSVLQLMSYEVRSYLRQPRASQINA